MVYTIVALKSRSKVVSTIATKQFLHLTLIMHMQCQVCQKYVINKDYTTMNCDFLYIEENLIE